jgi:hypothetical protein
MSDEMVTAGEFGRWRGDFQAFQARLDHQLGSGFDAINERLDALNGRTRTQAEAIVALDAKILHISSRGCARYDEHREAITQLAAPALSKKQQAGVAAGAGAGLVGLIEIAKVAVLHFWK